MSKKYSHRINQLIQRKVTQLLLEQSNDPRLAEVTITDVSVNRDTTRAEIYFSVIGTPDEILGGAASTRRCSRVVTQGDGSHPETAEHPGIGLYLPSAPWAASRSCCTN